MAQLTRPASGLTYRLRLLESFMRTWRAYFWSELVVGLGTPLMYLISMGIGMGVLVNRHGTEALGGVPYIAFIAPALLVAATFQLAVGEASFNTYGRLEWQRTIWGPLATPVTPRQACDVVLMYIVTRVLIVASCFYLVLVAFGVAGGVGGLLMLPISVLTALSVSGWLIGIASMLTGSQNASVTFNMVFRFGVVPMSLLSASFFPLSGLPWSIRWLAAVSPLWHGNELARASVLGHLPAWQAVIHLTVLAVAAIAGYIFAQRKFVKRVVV